tara:strand:- start:629 stop:1390 length:762 start_codon:yes stop_codon:yes gene_type:complete
LAFLDPIFNPVLLPLINFNPFWGIVILSFIISLLIVIIYKMVTDQNEMKRLKDEQKEYQKKLKALKSNPEEMMKVQKEAMKKNMDYMKHSFKPTLITFIPIILIFGWMNAHLVYEPIYPGETFSVTAMFEEGFTGEAELEGDEEIELISEVKQEIKENQATWNLKSSKGEHFLTVKVGSDEQNKKVLITKDLVYEEPITSYQHSDIEQIKINYNKLKPAGNFSLFGWKPGWLGWYIIFSIVFSMGLRKLLKIY